MAGRCRRVIRDSSAVFGADLLALFVARMQYRDFYGRCSVDSSQKQLQPDDAQASQKFKGVSTPIASDRIGERSNDTVDDGTADLQQSLQSPAREEAHHRFPLHHQPCRAEVAQQRDSELAATIECASDAGSTNSLQRVGSSGGDHVAKKGASNLPVKRSRVNQGRQKLEGAQKTLARDKQRRQM